VSVLENTLNGADGAGYFHGTFVLRLTVNACEVLSISDSNKGPLVTSPLVSLLVRALRMFVNGGPPVGLCGGGGDDTETAELAIGTLAQLAFYYDSDAALQEKYLTTANSGFKEVLSRFANSEKVSNTAKDTAKWLLKRLSEKSKSVAAQPESQVGTGNSVVPAHIMLSYCWNATARPELVQQLHASLCARGYDVWLDTVSTPTRCASLMTPPRNGTNL
jgi:hypothetical protein